MAAMARDTIYQLPHQRIGEFTFDQTVVDVFPDMIARSVPGYASVLSMIEQLTCRFAVSQSNIYDLGCSLGAATRLIRSQAPADCCIQAVDSSPAMVERLREIIANWDEELNTDQTGRFAPVHLHLSDVCDIDIKNASFIVLNWTLQFVPPEERQSLLQRIFSGLIAGGALLLSEKICFSDPNQQRMLTELHHDFKRAHGYSDLEIAQKRSALENRLIPETLAAHCDRLSQVGFQQIVPWFQCFNFVSILAVKSN
jgi:tRNA (cmo5U34)-methyltransferase